MKNTEEAIRAELIAQCVKAIEKLRWVEEVTSESEKSARNGYNIALDDAIFAIQYKLPEE